MHDPPNALLSLEVMARFRMAIPSPDNRWKEPPPRIRESVTQSYSGAISRHDGFFRGAREPIGRRAENRPRKGKPENGSALGRGSMRTPITAMLSTH